MLLGLKNQQNSLIYHIFPLKAVAIEQIAQEGSGELSALLLVGARIRPIHDIVEKYGTFHNNTIWHAQFGLPVCKLG